MADIDSTMRYWRLRSLIAQRKWRAAYEEAAKLGEHSMPSVSWVVVDEASEIPVRVWEAFP